MGLCGVYRLTIEQLAQELSRKHVAEEGRTTASALVLDAVTRRSVDAVARDGSLKYFGGVATAPRFSGAALRTLRELRLERIERSRLSHSGPAAADLGIFLDRYTRELTTSRYWPSCNLFEPRIERSAAYDSGVVLGLVFCRRRALFHFGPPVKCHKIFETVPGVMFKTDSRLSIDHRRANSHGQCRVRTKCPPNFRRMEAAPVALSVHARRLR